MLSGEVPFVLCRSGDEYEPVSKCYVHGIINVDGLIKAARCTQPGFDYGMLHRLSKRDEEPLPLVVEKFVLKSHLVFVGQL